MALLARHPANARHRASGELVHVLEGGPIQVGRAYYYAVVFPDGRLRPVPVEERPRAPFEVAVSALDPLE